MKDNTIKQINGELEDILKLNKSRPYVFRTRLERVLFRLSQYEKENKNNELKSSCDCIREKLHYISDHSNQTADGSLKSFNLLEQDIINLKNNINMIN